MMTTLALGTTVINHIIYRDLESRLRQTAEGKREFVPCDQVKVSPYLSKNT